MLPNALATFGDLIKTSFIVKLPNANEIKIGERYGNPEFQLIINNEQGLRALKAGDELALSEAYINKNIDLIGKVDMLKLLEITKVLSKTHPFYSWWSKFSYFFQSQVFINKKSIAQHYELDDDFYLSFLDKTRAYSHGIFQNDEESLETASLRKLEFAKNSCQIAAGMRVLDLGAGWGCAVEYLGNKGIHVDALTISEHSARFINNVISTQKLAECHVFNVDFLEYTPANATPYDALVSLGSLEHLPHYESVLSKCSALLKEGAYAYFDASAKTPGQFTDSEFINKHIFSGNHECLDIYRFLNAVKNSDFELISVHNDTHNYFLTLKGWATNLEQHKDLIIQRWDESLYRKFQLYFWGCCHRMATNDLQAYRIVLRKKTISRAQ